VQLYKKRGTGEQRIKRQAGGEDYGFSVTVSAPMNTFKFENRLLLMRLWIHIRNEILLDGFQLTGAVAGSLKEPKTCF
jgi:hypothetical protein